jgi:hypothetical protein
MKKIVALLLPAIISCAVAFANYSDTTIRGVAVVFNYSTSIFPDSWRSAEINASGEPIAAGEIERTKNISIIALNKYPRPVLAENLKAVYFLKSMKFYNTPFGGTNSFDNLYLTNDGFSSGYTNDYLEQTFHHEFSSILFRNHPEFLDTAAWNKANVQGFMYNDPGEGVGAIQKNQSSQDIDTVLCRKGILTQYALSAMENDINTLAQNLFCPERDFWKTVDRFPRVKAKVLLLINFYNKFSPAYTERYFRKFDTRGDGLI